MTYVEPKEHVVFRSMLTVKAGAIRYVFDTIHMGHSVSESRTLDFNHKVNYLR